MIDRATTLPALVAAAIVAGAGVVAGLALGLGIARLGVFVPLATIGLLACWGLLHRPALTLGLLVGTAVAFEDTPGAFLTVSPWYQGLPVLFLGPTDVLLFVLIGGVAWEISRTQDAALLDGPFTPPVLLLFVATMFGLVSGRAAGASTMAIFPQIRPLLFLVALVPLSSYVLSKKGRWRTALQAAAIVIPIKAATGVLTRLLGGEMSPGQDPVSFYEPTMNFLMVLFLLTVAGAALRRVPLAKWVWLSTPLVTLSLLLSFRRSFWVAALLGVFLVVIVASGRRSRPLVVLGMAGVTLALWAVMSAGGSTDSTNPIIDRAESLSPSRLESSSGDRYRLEEQRNVIAELRAHPLQGLGLGIPWTQRYPISESHPGGRYYSHVTPLWYWLKLGPLGVAAYLWMAGLAVFVGYERYRHSREGLIRVVGLAIAAGWVGLVVAELTGPFTGIDFRLTIVVGAVLGWLTATGRRSLLAGAPEPVEGDAGEVVPRIDPPLARTGLYEVARR